MNFEKFNFMYGLSRSFLGINTCLDSFQMFVAYLGSSFSTTSSVDESTDAGFKQMIWSFPFEM